jgi:hypothetical protein
MKTIKSITILAAAAVSLSGLSAAVARAQTAAPVSGSDPLVPAMRLSQTPASDAAARLSKATGAAIVTDHTVASLPVTLDLSAASLSAALRQIAAALPAGTVVKTVMLPAPPPGTSGAALNGDQVAALALAQESLYKPTFPAMAVPGAAPASSAPRPTTSSAPNSVPGEVNILGKRLPAEQAAPAISVLGLRPVYLLTNANANDSVQKLNTAQYDALRLMMSMTPEQKKQVADQQFNALMNMDPALRRQMVQQQMEVGMQFFQRIQSLPADQRSAFWRDITGGRFDGTIPNRPGGAGGFNPFGGGQ